MMMKTFVYIIILFFIIPPVCNAQTLSNDYDESGYFRVLAINKIPSKYYIKEIGGRKRIPLYEVYLIRRYESNYSLAFRVLSEKNNIKPRGEKLKINHIYYFELYSIYKSTYGNELSDFFPTDEFNYMGYTIKSHKDEKIENIFMSCQLDGIRYVKTRICSDLKSSSF